MARTVVGLFDRFADAEDAIGELAKSGIDRNRISIVAKDAKGEYVKLAGGSSLVAGAGTGAAIGGVAGLILGLAAIAIPGVGPVVAAGPLATALGSAGVGAAAGGIMGALTGMNIPEDDARYYAEAIGQGGALILYNSTDEQAEYVREVLNRSGARNVEERNAGGRNQGARDIETQRERAQLRQTPEADAPQITRSGARIYVDGLEMDPRKSRFEDFEPDYRSNFDEHFKSSGYTYEQFTPAYRYGYSLAHEERYRESEWRDVEPDAERDWEERNPGTWSQVKDAVRHAWEHKRRS